MYQTGAFFQRNEFGGNDQVGGTGNLAAVRIERLIPQTDQVFSLEFLRRLP